MYGYNFMLPLFIPVWLILTVPGVESALSLYWEILYALLQSFFHHSVNDFLCNWILEGMRNSTGTNAYFVSNVLLLPTLEVKLYDLHVNRLQGLQGNVVSSRHGLVLLSISWWNSLELYYFYLFYMSGSAGSVKFENFLLMLHWPWILSWIYRPCRPYRPFFLNSLTTQFSWFSCHLILCP